MILTLSTAGGRMSGVGFLDYAATCGAVEAFSRALAGEVGASGVRVICLRSDVIPKALPISYVGKSFEGYAERAGTTVAAMVSGRAETGTLLKRFPDSGANRRLRHLRGVGPGGRDDGGDCELDLRVAGGLRELSERSEPRLLPHEVGEGGPTKSARMGCGPLRI